MKDPLMNKDARAVTKQAFKDILDANTDYTAEDLEDLVREIVDEYGVDGEDFEQAVQEILELPEMFDHNGNLDKEMVDEFLTSYGY